AAFSSLLPPASISSPSPDMVLHALSMTIEAMASIKMRVICFPPFLAGLPEALLQTACPRVAAMDTPGAAPLPFAAVAAGMKAAPTACGRPRSGHDMFAPRPCPNEPRRSHAPDHQAQARE